MRNKSIHLLIAAVWMATLLWAALVESLIHRTTTTLLSTTATAATTTSRWDSYVGILCSRKPTFLSATVDKDVSSDSNKNNKNENTNNDSSAAAPAAQVGDDVDDDDNINTNDDNPAVVLMKQVFPDAELVTLSLPDHQPMGCTVEESLDANDEYVFLSRITEGGNADQAGLQVGDVVVALTGPFGGNDLTVVLDAGVDKIKRMVSAMPTGEPLTLQVARGTEVLQRHETAVVDMCNQVGTSDKEVENCVVNFIAEGYASDVQEPASADEDDACENDDDADCLIDDMMNLWADELPAPPTTSGITDAVNGDRSANKPKPWSSRSSPSGTYVRDPKTGQMRNID